MGHQSETPVTDTFRRIIEEKFPPIANEEIAMTQNTATQSTTDKTAAPQSNGTAENNAEVRRNISQLLFQASASAGTPQFEADTKVLMKAIDDARIKVELPGWKETAKSAAVYGGVTALCMIGTAVAIRLIFGNGQASGSN
jgi:Tfp pilus assembly protein PilV